MSSCGTNDRAGHAAVDPQYLQGLRAELGGDGDAVDGFVATFVRMWPGRLRRVAEAARCGDVSALVDSTLSIRSSSRMIGAVCLGTVAHDVEQSGRAGDLAQVRRLIPDLAAAGDRAVEHLSDLVVPGSP